MEAGSENEVGISFILHLTLGLSMRVTSAAPPHQNLMNASHGLTRLWLRSDNEILRMRGPDWDI